MKQNLGLLATAFGACVAVAQGALDVVENPEAAPALVARDARAGPLGATSPLEARAIDPQIAETPEQYSILRRYVIPWQRKQQQALAGSKDSSTVSEAMQMTPEDSDWDTDDTSAPNSSPKGSTSKGSAAKTKGDKHWAPFSQDNTLSSPSKTSSYDLRKSISWRKSFHSVKDLQDQINAGKIAAPLPKQALQAAIRSRDKAFAKSKAAVRAKKTKNRDGKKGSTDDDDDRDDEDLDKSPPDNDHSADDAYEIWKDAKDPEDHSKKPNDKLKKPSKAKKVDKVSKPKSKDKASKKQSTKGKKKPTGVTGVPTVNFYDMDGKLLIHGKPRQDRGKENSFRGVTKTKMGLDGRPHDKASTNQLAKTVIMQHFKKNNAVLKIYDSKGAKKARILKTDGPHDNLRIHHFEIKKLSKRPRT